VSHHHAPPALPDLAPRSTVIRPNDRMNNTVSGPKGDWVLVFNNSVPSRESPRNHLLARLEAVGLVVVEEPVADIIFVHITCPDPKIAKEAERIRHKIKLNKYKI
jgi:hypothetical protein